MSACDDIENPEVPRPELDYSLSGGTEEDYPFPTWSQNNDNTKRVLFEDYTGHKCVPCFLASQQAEEIEETDLNRIFLVSVHASPTGGFQEVDAEHPTDFTTPAGNAYAETMSPGEFVGNPLGTTDRITTELNQIIWQGRSEWEANVELQLNQPARARLQHQYNYYPETNGLFVHTEVEFLDEISGPINVTNYLIRKQVVSPQSTPFGLNKENEHHQVLSGVISPIWGDRVSSTSTTIGSKHYTDNSLQLIDPALDPTYEQENLMIVTYVHNRETFEVYQTIWSDIE